MSGYGVLNKPPKIQTWYEKSISEFCESAEGLQLLALCNAASGNNYQSLEYYVVRSRYGTLNLVSNSPATTAAVQSHGIASPVAFGTLTVRFFALTNYFTGTQRGGYVSAGTAGNFSAIRSNTELVIGGGLGFTWIGIFGCSDAQTVSGARQFCGITYPSGTPANVEPSTLINGIGIGHGAADSNMKLFYGGNNAQAPIDLGANFPANTLSVDMYELALFSFGELNNKIGYRVKRLNTGHIITGILSANTPGTELPAPTLSLYTYNLWRTNNAQNLAVGLDISSIYRGLPK